MNIKDDSTDEYAPYVPPILVFILRASGIISFLGSIFVPVFIGLYRNGPLFGVYILIGIFQAIILFGVAQVIDLLGRMEYNSRKLPLIERHLDRLTRR